MNKKYLLVMIMIGIGAMLLASGPACAQEAQGTQETEEKKMIMLPQPKTEGQMSLEAAIQKRRSIRSFTDEKVGLEAISQLVWAAQGITDQENSLRAAPSAGALYPLETYVITEEGFYHYDVLEHALELIKEGDLRQELADAGWNQPMIAQAPLNILICAVFKRITSRYGDRGVGYVYEEVGHAAQNIHLQAVSLGLGSVPVGAFDDKKVKSSLSLGAEVEPLYIIPVGTPAEER